MGWLAGGIVAVLIINGFALPRLVGKTLGLDYKEAIISIIGDLYIIFLCIFVSLAWIYWVEAAATWKKYMFNYSELYISFYSNGDWIFKK